MYNFTIDNGTFNDGAVMTITSGTEALNGDTFNYVFAQPSSGGSTTSISSTLTSTLNMWNEGFNGDWWHQQPYGYSYWYPHACPTDNKTEKAFAVAKALLAKSRVTVSTPQDFIALVEELKEVL